MDAEFDRLYSLLRLTPACSPDELHRAYRRAVAELHPDRSDVVASAEQQTQLRDLIALHAKATEFHRRHGRLPGANPRVRPRLDALLAQQPRAEVPKRASRRRWLIFAPLLAFVAWQMAQQAALPAEPSAAAASKA